MSDEPARYKSESLPKYRWATFFEELLKSRQGQPVNILEGADFLSMEIPTTQAPLANIVYESQHSGALKHKGLLTVTTEGSHGETVQVNDPTLVWVFQDFEGIVFGVEVIDEKNNRVALRFA